MRLVLYCHFDRSEGFNPNAVDKSPAVVTRLLHYYNRFDLFTRCGCDTAASVPVAFLLLFSPLEKSSVETARVSIYFRSKTILTSQAIPYYLPTAARRFVSFIKKSLFYLPQSKAIAAATARSRKVCCYDLPRK